MKHSRTRSGGKPGGKPDRRSGHRQPRRAPEQSHPLEGREAELVIDALALGGAGVARLPESFGESAGMAVFVPGALPGETAKVRISRMRPRHAEAVLVETLVPSPEAVTPACPHAGTGADSGVCGGCPLQHQDPAQQLAWKERQILDALRRIGRVEPEGVLPAVPAQSVYGFRNKMEFAFQGLGASLKLGLHARGEAGRVLDLRACAIFPAEGFPILEAVRGACQKAGLAALERRTGQGLLRHLVLRHSLSEDRYLAQLITAPTPADGGPAGFIRQLGQELLGRFPKLAGFVHAERKAADGLAQAERTLLALGESALTEELGGVKYSVSADAFFQTSSGGALALYSALRELLALNPGETLYDLYSGGGGIALFLARACARVLGLEANPAAVADAEANARRNRLDNCRFLRAELSGPEPLPAKLPEGFQRPDAVVLDPPREGLDRGVAEWLLRQRPARVGYVSCNPATLARDAGILCGEGGFALAAVRAVDLFPHTAHAECLALFTPRG